MVDLRLWQRQICGVCLRIENCSNWARRFLNLTRQVWAKLLAPLVTPFLWGSGLLYKIWPPEWLFCTANGLRVQSPPDGCALIHPRRSFDFFNYWRRVSKFLRFKMIWSSSFEKNNLLAQILYKSAEPPKKRRLVPILFFLIWSILDFPLVM